MKPISFPEQTGVIAEDQPEYQNLPAYVARDEAGTVVCCWRLTWRERLKLCVTGRIWQSMLTFGDALQPQLLTVEKPEMITHERELDDAW